MAFNTSDCWESAQGDAAHSGVRVGMAVCPSDATQSDDWFISPKLQLGTNSSFSFWALSPKPGSWGNDEFEVLVSTTDNVPSSFSSISSVTEAPDTWQQFTYDLSAYDNQEIYVAIRHVSTDKFMLWIDDLEINSTINCVQPTILSQPNDVMVCEGGSAAFSVTVDATSPTYQWQLDGNNINGATSSSLTLSNVTLSDDGVYTCVVTDSCGNVVTSNSATLTVNTNVIITTQPQGGTVCEGQSFTLSVSATGNTLSYQWRLNGNNITGAVNDTYTISNVSISDGGDYSCVVTNSCGTVESDVVSLDVNEAPVITSQPVDVQVNEGDNFTLSVGVTGTNLSYQWYKDNNALVDGGNVLGATTSTLSISSATSNDEGWYYCEISNVCGNELSDSAHVIIVVYMSNVDSRELSISPNPTKGILDVKGSKIINKISVITSDGRVLKVIKDIDNRNYALDISDVPKGMYVIRIKFKDNSEVETKVIKK